MSNYAADITPETPRLAVMYAVDDQGRDTYQWGMFGPIPIFNLIGYISRVQTELLKPFPELEPCDQKALIIAHVSSGPHSTARLRWYINKDIPRIALVGYLETVKQLVVGSQVAQHAAAQQVRLLGPDGQPMRG